MTLVDARKLCTASCTQLHTTAHNFGDRPHKQANLVVYPADYLRRLCPMCVMCLEAFLENFYFP